MQLVYIIIIIIQTIVALTETTKLLTEKENSFLNQLERSANKMDSMKRDANIERKQYIENNRNLEKNYNNIK